MFCQKIHLVGLRFTSDEECTYTHPLDRMVEQPIQQRSYLNNFYKTPDKRFGSLYGVRYKADWGQVSWTAQLKPR